MLNRNYFHHQHLWGSLWRQPEILVLPYYKVEPQTDKAIIWHAQICVAHKIIYFGTRKMDRKNSNMNCGNRKWWNGQPLVHFAVKDGVRLFYVFGKFWKLFPCNLHFCRMSSWVSYYRLMNLLRFVMMARKSTLTFGLTSDPHSVGLALDTNSLKKPSSSVPSMKPLPVRKWMNNRRSLISCPCGIFHEWNAFVASTIENFQDKCESLCPCVFHCHGTMKIFLTNHIKKEKKAQQTTEEKMLNGM